MNNRTHRYLKYKADEAVQMASLGELPEQVHLFDEKSVKAINAALAARRPLLVRGEPGVGKSQLARAAARKLGRAFVSYTVDMHTESHDLLWSFDAVQRLADAQLGKALGEDRMTLRQALAINNYIHPAPLWWGFNWESARTQTVDVLNLSPPPQLNGCDPANGCVVLIDEIDKAEMDVPNGLLEALGDGSFTPQGRKEGVNASEKFPLVIITTNEERGLPDAFVRRCLVLHLDPFTGAREEIVERMVLRGTRHFPELDEAKVIRKAVDMLLEDRANTKQKPLPGQAEYLDLLRAVFHLQEDGMGKAEDLIAEVAEFTLSKQKGRQR